MPFHKFEQNDIFYNRIKTYPQVNFIIYDTNIYYNNKPRDSGSWVNNAGMVPTGYISLYELNIDRKATNLIYPFVVKNGSLESFRTISTASFNIDWDNGDIMRGSYPLSASLSSDYYAFESPKNTAGDVYRPRISALRTALSASLILSPSYSYSSSLGDKSTQEFRLVSIPSIFYGSSIQKGSVSCKFYVSGTLIGELRDNRRNGELRQVNNTVGTVALSNLYAYYKFDQTLGDGDWDVSDVLIDSMGSYNATPGGNNIPQGVGKFISASAFREQADEDFFKYNGIPITGSLSAGGGFSVSCWVKKATDSSGYNDDVTVVGCKNSLVAWRLYYVDWNQNKATWYSRDIDGNTRYYTSSVPSTSDDWIHFVGTYQAGTEPKLYVNGEIQSDAGIQVKSGATMGELSGLTANLRIGGDMTGDDYMSGSLDDLRLYKGVLSEAEIERIYNSTSGAGSEIATPSGSVAGVVLYDEGFLILTGSWLLSSHTEDYYGGGANKPRWIDFSTTGSGIPSSSFALNFSGTNYVPTLTMLAQAPISTVNYSNNPTAIQYQAPLNFTASSGSSEYIEYPKKPIKNIVSGTWSDPEPAFKRTVYINYVGLYDEQRNLIGIAKMANPVRKRDTDDFTFKLKLDF